MEFLLEYGLFLAKAITIVVAIAIIVGLIVSAGFKNQANGDMGEIEVTKLNDRFDSMKDSLKQSILDSEDLKQEAKDKKKQDKADKKQQKKQKKDKPSNDENKKRLYVLDFDGDVKASAVDCLREEITALLTIAKATDEVVLRLESPGGMVHGYGLAASQLVRITQKSIPLTICVDKVAASGGYMMACVADKICAAPFAIIGSIGVVAQLPNFHRLLKKNDVDVELLTAGEYKRTLTMFGENTEKGREKFVDDLEMTHELFKEFVNSQRPELNIDEVATGEIWYGSQAKEKQLIDELSTSDDYITAQAEESDIYQIQYATKKTLTERIGLNVQVAIEASINNLMSKINASRFIK